VVTELDEVGLVLLVSGSNKAVDLRMSPGVSIGREMAVDDRRRTYLALELDLLVIAVRNVPLC
jgi:hypothetical protein